MRSVTLTRFDYKGKIMEELKVVETAERIERRDIMKRSIERLEGYEHDIEMLKQEFREKGL